MRNEYVDASEIERRVHLGIYDHEEFARAMAWTEKYCKSNEGTEMCIRDSSGAMSNTSFSFPSGDATENFCWAEAVPRQNRSAHIIKSFLIFIIIYLVRKYKRNLHFSNSA